MEIGGVRGSPRARQHGVQTSPCERPDAEQARIPTRRTGRMLGVSRSRTISPHFARIVVEPRSSTPSAFVFCSVDLRANSVCLRVEFFLFCFAAGSDNANALNRPCHRLSVPAGRAALGQGFGGVQFTPGRPAPTRPKHQSRGTIDIRLEPALGCPRAILGPSRK